MAIYVPRIVSFVGLTVLFLGIFVAYYLRGAYVLTLYKLKAGNDSESKFLQYLQNQHGDPQHLLLLKPQKISFSGTHFIPDYWDYATLQWHERRQDGMDVSPTQTGNDAAGIERSYPVPFTPGPFEFINTLISAKRQVNQITGFQLPRPLKKAETAEVDVSEIKKALETKRCTSETAPVHVLNYLKYKSGSWSYQWYSVNVLLRIFPDLGAYLTVAGHAQDGHWDTIAIATYPNISTMLEMFQSEKWNEINKYRAGGLEDTNLIVTQNPP